jgi:hypothetical protein
MSLEHSPSLKDFAHGMPPPPDPTRRRRRIRALITVMSVIFAVLFVINLVQLRSLTLARGSGTISGQVLDAYGAPVVAELIVERTDLVVRSDLQGRFVLPQVPVGAHLLVVAHDGVGVEYPVVVVAGAHVDVGVLRAETTAVPLP